MTMPTASALMSCWHRSGNSGESSATIEQETTVSVAVVVGNPKPRSRTFQAAHIVAERLAGLPLT